MTREEKKLILKDLGGRLAFGVKCYITEVDTTSILGAIQEDGENTLYDFWEDSRKIQYIYQLYTSEFKPCLFPMSSISENQKYDFYCRFVENDCDFDDFKEFYLDNSMWHKLLTSLDDIEAIVDWFNKNHIDWRGLIPKGLAIDATGLNIY